MREANDHDARRREAMRRALGALANLTLLPAVAAGASGLPLTPPDLAGRTTSLEQALARRRSVRHYSAQPIALAAASQLLWAAQGLSAPGGWRTAPSAGALYPLELQLVVARVDGLAAGVYRYVPAAHALQPSNPALGASTLQQAAMGQTAVGAAAAVVVISAVEARSAGRYGARAPRYIAFEAGAASQGLALQAAALGLGCVVIGAFDDVAVARALQLPPGEQPVVLMPLGVPA